jgi:hypothetical protein
MGQPPTPSDLQSLLRVRFWGIAILLKKLLTSRLPQTEGTRALVCVGSGAPKSSGAASTPPTASRRRAKTCLAGATPAGLDEGIFVILPLTISFELRIPIEMSDFDLSDEWKCAPYTGGIDCDVEQRMLCGGLAMEPPDPLTINAPWVGFPCTAQPPDAVSRAAARLN